MKQKRNLLIGLSSFSLLVASGLSFGFLHNGFYSESAQLVKADSYLSAGYYLVGDFNGWSTAVDGGALPMVDNTAKVANEYYYQGVIASTGDSFYKMIHSDGAGGFTWYSYTSIAKENYINSWVVTAEGESNGNIGVYVKSGYQVIDFYLKTDGSAYLAWGSVYASVGDSAKKKLTSYDDDEYTVTFDGAAEGDLVAFTNVHDETIGFVRKDETKNNITTLKKVHVGGTIALYYNFYTSETWVTGYEDLYDFAASFLDETISAGVCNPDASTWSSLETDFNTNLSASQKAVFAANVAAVSTGGQSSVPYQRIRSCCALRRNR